MTPLPKTKENPKATADAYVKTNRNFPLDVIGEWYTQEIYRVPKSDIYADTIRFYLDSARTRYWERLIDKVKGAQRINFAGKRKSFPKDHELFDDFDGTLVKGDWWMPPTQKIRPDTRVFIVEGIFHSIAFHLNGFNSVANLMAGNFPTLSIEPYLDLDIE